jgi:hypothetical protein
VEGIVANPETPGALRRAAIARIDFENFIVVRYGIIVTVGVRRLR